MKNAFRLGLCALCVLCLLLPGSNFAAKKGWNSSKTCYYIKKGKKLVKATGLQKIKGQYYYFNKKGKVQKKKWGKNLTVKGKKYTFYFGKDGKAYKAKGDSQAPTTQVKVVTISGKKYGFDEKAHMVTGLWSTMKGDLFFFNSKGVYDSNATKKYREVIRSDATSETLLEDVKSVFGTPKSETTEESCNYFDATEEDLSSGNLDYTAYYLTYDHISIALTKSEKSGLYCMEGASPLER